MFHVPEYYHDLSLKLSEVLDDIGVNETMVMKWRKAILMQETVFNIANLDMYAIYHFGSLSEGTTTYGLKSDLDSLLCGLKRAIVIQDLTEWQPGFLNLLMTKDENTPPGYCQLQVIRRDLPLPYVHVENEHFVKVSRDRVLLRNTFITSIYKEHSGPSYATTGVHGRGDQDNVLALSCKSWPNDARQWLHKEGANTWPTQEIKNYAEKSNCFVVPVGSNINQKETLEWRISTSFAERSLMFSLNITQIRCYILMKMILKTYLNSYLSSFMCKTVLLYCIENTQPSIWSEFNLMKCLVHCLQRLYTCLKEGNCPHFIMPGNNLMVGKISVQVKYILQEKLCRIIKSDGHALFGIQIDDLDRRLQFKLSTLHHPAQTRTLRKSAMSMDIQNAGSLNVALVMIFLHNEILQKSSGDSSEAIQQRLLHQLQIYTTVHRNGNIFEQIISSLPAAPICSTLGAIKASFSLQTNNDVSSDAFNWLHAGLNSDVASGRLKLASVLYSIGDIMGTEAILREAETKYDVKAVEPVCGCHDFPIFRQKVQFAEETILKDITYALRENTAFCVRFTTAEINCIPYELLYEMFRRTRDENIRRKMDFKYWMELVAVDSLPYLYFLQYKIYDQLQRFTDKQRALNSLMVSIGTERNFGHRETALNLLGQLMEKEKRIHDALYCYTSSLHIRNRNNVAIIHICKLLSNIVNTRHG